MWRGISSCFILDVLYKSLDKFLKLMTALECVVSLFSVVSIICIVQFKMAVMFVGSTMCSMLLIVLCYDV